MDKEALEVLAKWRAAWGMMATMGTSAAFERCIRDMAEHLLMQRAELNALANLMVQKGVFAATEFTAQVEVEAELHSKVLEQSFPGFSASVAGLTLTQPMAERTMRAWNTPINTNLQPKG